MEDGIDHFSGLGVTLRLDHGEGSLGGGLKFLSSENISEVDEGQLSRVDRNNRMLEEIAHSNTGNEHPFHEDSSVFHVILKEKS